MAAVLSPPAVERFDRELRVLVAADFPRQPPVIPHRLFVLTCRQPKCAAPSSPATAL
jgi:nitrate reductase cytochrome c-type subunit